jgi:hypothetical protein
VCRRMVCRRIHNRLEDRIFMAWKTDVRTCAEMKFLGKGVSATSTVKVDKMSGRLRSSKAGRYLESWGISHT